MSELKPCPFCGGGCVIKHVDYYGDTKVNEYYISCDNDNCLTMPDSITCDTEDRAIKAWNTRI